MIQSKSLWNDSHQQHDFMFEEMSNAILVFNENAVFFLFLLYAAVANKSDRQKERDRKKKYVRP